MVNETLEKELLDREQYEQWIKTMPKNYCPFCDAKNHKILKEGEHWLWIANKAPYWKYYTLIIPKRHFVDFLDISGKEVTELKKMIKHAIGQYRKANIFDEMGDKFKRFIYFWRLRDELIDPNTGSSKFDHFHLHIAPDIEHSWDPIMDNKAAFVDINTLME